jgi:glycosyltransferase involved in cell wall biosynthesis
LKIIYYSPHPTHDIVSEVGYSTHQRETILAMQDIGHEVLPVILGGTEKTNVEEYHKNIGNSGVKKRLIKRFLPTFLLNAVKDILLVKHDVRAAKRLEEAILEFKPDLVYERGEYMQDKGLLLCNKLGIPHFLEVNSPCVEEMREFEGPNLFHFWGFRKERNKLKNTKHIFAVSSALKDYLVKKYHPRAQIHVIPNCINENKAIPPANDIAVLRNQLGLDGKFVFGFVGSIFPHHGIGKLIEAFSEVVKKQPSCRLIIIGGGVLQPKFEAMANQLLPENTFIFTGKIPHAEVIKYIGIFDVGVMPDSNWYGSPVKVLEYGLMKKLILAPDNGPLNDIMTSGTDGVLVKSGVENLAKSMFEVAENFDRFSDMGGAFYNRIMKEFTWKAQARKILENC